MSATVRATRARIAVAMEDPTGLIDNQLRLGAIVYMRMKNPRGRVVRAVVAPARFQPCVPDIPVTCLRLDRLAQTDVLGGGYLRLEWDDTLGRWHYPL